MEHTSFAGYTGNIRHIEHVTHSRCIESLRTFIYSDAIVDHNLAPVERARVTIKGNNFPRVSQDFRARRPADAPGMPGRPFEHARRSQQILGMCPRRPADLVDVSGMPGRLCCLEPLGRARHKFPHAIPFRGEPLAHQGFPPMLRVWEISFFPITRHPQSPSRHSAPSNILERMPARGNPSQKSPSGSASQTQ